MERAEGNCPCCNRLDVSHRVIIGPYERTVCRMCADGYKKTAGVVIEPLAGRAPPAPARGRRLPLA